MLVVAGWKFRICSDPLFCLRRWFLFPCCLIDMFHSPLRRGGRALEEAAPVIEILPRGGKARPMSPISRSPEVRRARSHPYVLPLRFEHGGRTTSVHKRPPIVPCAGTESTARNLEDRLNWAQAWVACAKWSPRILQACTTSVLILQAFHSSAAS